MCLLVLEKQNDIQPYVNIFILQPGIFAGTHCSIIQTTGQAKAAEDPMQSNKLNTLFKSSFVKGERENMNGW